MILNNSMDSMKMKKGYKNDSTETSSDFIFVMLSDRRTGTVAAERESPHKWIVFIRPSLASHDAGPVVHSQVVLHGRPGISCCKVATSSLTTLTSLIFPILRYLRSPQMSDFQE